MYHILLRFSVQSTMKNVSEILGTYSTGYELWRYLLIKRAICWEKANSEGVIVIVCIVCVRLNCVLLHYTIPCDSCRALSVSTGYYYDETKCFLWIFSMQQCIAFLCCLRFRKFLKCYRKRRLLSIFMVLWFGCNYFINTSYVFLPVCQKDNLFNYYRR